MKWFRHRSDSLDDLFILALMDKFGPAGYVMWFGLIETIAAKENVTTTATGLIIRQSVLRKRLRVYPSKLQQMLDFCQANDKLFYTLTEGVLDIELSEIVIGAGRGKLENTLRFARNFG